MNDLTNDQLLTRLLDTLHACLTDSAKPGHCQIAAELEAQLRARLAALEPLAQAAVNRRKVLDMDMDKVTKRMLDNAFGALEDAADTYARAQAQDGAA